MPFHFSRYDRSHVQFFCSSYLRDLKVMNLGDQPLHRVTKHRQLATSRPRSEPLRDRPRREYRHNQILIHPDVVVLLSLPQNFIWVHPRGQGRPEAGVEVLHGRSAGLGNVPEEDRLVRVVRRDGGGSGGPPTPRVAPVETAEKTCLVQMASDFSKKREN